MNHPTVMDFGAAAIISPDGSDKLPAALWPELAALVLLEPEPELRMRWVDRLEAALGVRDAHRAYVAGGLDEVRAFVQGKRAGQVVADPWRVDASLPWPGEGPTPLGHSLIELERDPFNKERWWRIPAIRPEDHQLAWFVARAATRMEDRAERSLVDAGFAVYVPRLTRWKRVSDRRIKHEQPLFGGYFFVGLGRGQSLSSADPKNPGVLEADGVHDLVRGSDRMPRQIAFKPIAEWLQDELDGEHDRTRRDKRKDPEPGTPVKIIGGMFTGRTVKFVERREDERIAVLLKVIRSSPEVEHVVDPEDIEMPGGEAQA